MEYPEKYSNRWNKIYNYARDGIIFSLEGHPFTLQGQKGKHPEEYPDGRNKGYHYARDGIIFSFKGHPFTLQAFTLQGTERELSTEISERTETNVPKEFLSTLQEMERKTLKVVSRVNSIHCSGDRMRQLQGHL